jgi:hypothetical protein
MNKDWPSFGIIFLEGNFPFPLLSVFFNKLFRKANNNNKFRNERNSHNSTIAEEIEILSSSSLNSMKLSAY